MGKKIGIDELKQVSGGLRYQTANKTCPSCHNNDRNENFDPVEYNDGCDKKIRFTCPVCQYQWSEDADE